MTIIDMQSAQSIPVSLGGDMSAARRSPGYLIGPDVKEISLEASWPVTGGPAGVFALEVLNNTADTSGAVHPACAQPGYLAQQPNGVAAGAFFLDRMKTAALVVCVSYTPESGGTGATPTVTLGIKR
jgi:hypothetical protein